MNWYKRAQNNETSFLNDKLIDVPGLNTDHGLTWWDIGHGDVMSGEAEIHDPRKNQNEHLWVYTNTGELKTTKKELVDDRGEYREYTEHDSYWLDDYVNNSIIAYGRVNVDDNKASIQLMPGSNLQPHRAQRVLENIMDKLFQQFGMLDFYFFRYGQ